MGGLMHTPTVQAVTNVFFTIAQTTNLVTSGPTSDTIGSEGYLFTFTRDKLFTGGAGMTNPIGRAVRVPWPEGLEAQAVTAGPSPGKAQVRLRRQDGQPFAIKTFKAKLLANTAGAGAAIEVMPMLNGEDGLPDPVMYNATGYYGSQFTYLTPALTGFDTYIITLYVDYALMSLTVVDPSAPPPRLDIQPLDVTTMLLSWPTNASGYVLESATNLPASLWRQVTNGFYQSSDFFHAELPFSDIRRFFRLRK